MAVDIPCQARTTQCQNQVSLVMYHQRSLRSECVKRENVVKECKGNMAVGHTLQWVANSKSGGRGGDGEGGKAARGGHCTRFNTGHATLPHCPFHPLFSNFSLIIIGREKIAVTLVFPAILFSITHQV